MAPPKMTNERKPTSISKNDGSLKRLKIKRKLTRSQPHRRHGPASGYSPDPPIEQVPSQARAHENNSGCILVRLLQAPQVLRVLVFVSVEAKSLWCRHLLPQRCYLPMVAILRHSQPHLTFARPSGPLLAVPSKVQRMDRYPLLAQPFRLLEMQHWWTVSRVGRQPSIDPHKMLERRP